MKISDLQQPKKDKIENVKQQVQEIQTVFDHSIRPQRGHTLFEVNLITKLISVAIFDEQPIINYTDALKGFITTKKKITRKEDCIYIMSLNVKNVIKILKRDFSLVGFSQHST